MSIRGVKRGGGRPVFPESTKDRRTDVRGSVGVGVSPLVLPERVSVYTGVGAR